MKRKAPAFQFYPGDWLRDLALHTCSLAARGLWIDLLCLMWDGEPKGYLRVAGVALSAEEIATLICARPDVIRKGLAELERRGVVSCDEDDGAYYSRRMVRDAGVRKARAEGGPLGADYGPLGAEYGVKGGRPKAKETPLKTPVEGGLDGGLSKPPPASASASASASGGEEEQNGRKEDLPSGGEAPPLPRLGFDKNGRKLNEQQARVQAAERIIFLQRGHEPPPASSIAKWLELIDEDGLISVIEQLEGSGKMDELKGQGQKRTAYIFACVKSFHDDCARMERGRP